jgi:Tetratricopeptide repeat.
MMNQRLLIAASATLMIFLNGCKSSEPVAKSKKEPQPVARKKEKTLTSEEKLQLDYLFFNAIKEKSTGNYDKARDLFNQVIRLDDSNDAAYYELARLYYQSKKFNDALYFARTAAQLKPQNEWYQLLLADVYMNTNRLNDAISLFEKLARSNPSRIEYYFNWANALIFAGKTEEAIKVYDMAEQKTGIEKDLIVQKQRMYLKLGKIDKAAAEIEKLISANPAEIGAYSLLVEMYQANRMKEKVLETVERMKKINPASPHVYLAMAEYYRSNNENDKSFEQLKLAFRSPELDPEIKIRILSSYYPLIQFKEEMLEQALGLSSIFTEVHPAEAIGHSIYGDFLSMARKPQKAAAEYRISLDLDPGNEQVWQQYLINLNESGNADTVIAESEKALSLFPNNPVFYLLNGMAYYEKKDFQKAADLLLSGSKMVVDNNNLLVDFYSRLGDCYNELKNYKESDNYMKKR